MNQTVLSAADRSEKLSEQRVRATAHLGVRRLDGRTRLARLHQEGAAKIRMPASSGDPLEGVLINTAGGLTGGDRIDWHVEAGPGAAAVVTTQAYEKVYRSLAGHAGVSARLVVGDGGRIAWLPQETIVFDGSAFARRLDVDLGAGAEALIVEATVFGRLAMGESVRFARFSDRWRVRQGGKLIHAEDFSIGPDIAAALGRRAVLSGRIATATLLLVSPDARDRLTAVRAIIGDEGGASAWSVAGSGKLLARLFAEDSYSLRRRLGPLIGLLNGEAGLPRVWST
jgi:urease accessory protein